MAYAEVSKLLARAGRVAPAWTAEGASPGIAELESYLKDAAATLDAHIAGHGFDVPLDPDSPEAEALSALNADMALLVALPATYTKDRGAVEELSRQVASRVNLSLSALEAGTHEVLVLLGSASTAASATSLWSQGGVRQEPAFRRGDIL